VSPELGLEMDNQNGAEETALGLAALMVLEAVGLQVAHDETLGAVSGLFAAAVIVCVLKRMTSEPD
jgi:hypothetical protein